MFFKLFLRVVFVIAAFMYILPGVEGIRLTRDPISLLFLSILFNILFAALEYVLSVVVVGINISTLSIGLIFSRLLEFITLLLAPSVAFYGCAKFLPQYCEVVDYCPSAIVAGITLGGVLFAQQLAVNRK